MFLQVMKKKQRKPFTWGKEESKFFFVGLLSRSEVLSRDLAARRRTKGCVRPLGNFQIPPRGAGVDVVGELVGAADEENEWEEEGETSDLFFFLVFYKCFVSI